MLASATSLRIQERLNGHPANENGGQFISSIGVILCDDRYENIDEILRNVKAA